jgi:hypothetical protein
MCVVKNGPHVKAHKHDEKDDRDENNSLETCLAPVLQRMMGSNHPRLRELAFSRTRVLMMAPTLIAKATNAAAITTVVALTSPRSRSRSREAV